MTRTLIYDIECSDLSPDRGRLFAFCYKWLGEKKVTVLALVDYNKPCECCGLMRLDDRQLVKDAHKVMSQADVTLTFNGRNFDDKYMATKFMRGRLHPLGKIRAIDLYQVARSSMRLSRKSLANISKYLNLKHQKTSLDWDLWDRASEGDASAHRYIKAHGAADVLVTEELYLDHLRPYVPNHPFLFEDREPCQRCGGRMKRDKKITTLSAPKVQYRCTKCGGYQTRAA